MKGYKVHLIYAGALVFVVLGIVGGFLYMQQRELDFEKKQTIIEELGKKAEQERQEQEQLDQQAMLDTCLATANRNYHAFWDSEVARLSRNDNSLPEYTADRVDQSHQEDKDECFKRYP